MFGSFLSESGFWNTSGILNGKCWYGCETVLHDRAGFDLVRLKNMILRFEKANWDCDDILAKVGSQRT